MNFTSDRAGITELGRSYEIRRYLTKAAGMVRDLAVASAPVGKSGNYKGSITTVAATSTQPAARVIANDNKAVWIEYGTGIPAPSPHFQVLTRATRKAGFNRVDFVPHVLKGKRG